MAGSYEILEKYIAGIFSIIWRCFTDLIWVCKLLINNFFMTFISGNTQSSLKLIDFQINDMQGCFCVGKQTLYLTSIGGIYEAIYILFVYNSASAPWIMSVNNFRFFTNISRGRGGRVVTLSPPTSEAGVRSPSRPYVGKLVLACRWSAVYSTEP